MQNQTQESNRFQKINSLILNNEDFLVVTDGSSFDSVASATSLTLLLKSLGKRVTLYSPKPVNAANLSPLKGLDNFVNRLENSNNKLLITFNCPLADIERVSSSDENEKLSLSVEFKKNSQVVDVSQVKVKPAGPSYSAGFFIGIDLDNETELASKGRWVWVAQAGAQKPWAEVNVIEKKATLSESITSFISRSGFEIPIEVADNLYWGIKKGTNNFEIADSIALETAAYCLRVKEEVEKKFQSGGGKIPQAPLEAIEAKESGIASSEWQKPPIFTSPTTSKL